MYKVVRHGENSLQYKILAQEEEGLPAVKRRSSTRTATFKIIAIITLLIIGIIASAFIVPLLLANDFIAVTGTFQKFSVSTLRRSHSGNHVVVIAKKPYGWNPPHPTSHTPHNASKPPPDITSPSVATLRSREPSTVRLSTVLPTTTTTTPATTTTTATTTTAATTTPTEKLTQPPTTGSERNWGWRRFSPTIIRQEQSFQKEDKVVSSQPVWFGSSGVEAEKERQFLYPAAGLLVVVVILGTILCKTLLRGRAAVEKETSQSKEDKTKLLKHSDHDEE